MSRDSVTVRHVRVERGTFFRFVHCDHPLTTAMDLYRTMLQANIGLMTGAISKRTIEKCIRIAIRKASQQQEEDVVYRDKSKVEVIMTPWSERRMPIICFVSRALHSRTFTSVRKYLRSALTLLKAEEDDGQPEEVVMDEEEVDYDEEADYVVVGGERRRNFQRLSTSDLTELYTSERNTHFLHKTSFGIDANADTQATIDMMESDVQRIEDELAYRRQYEQ